MVPKLYQTGAGVSDQLLEALQVGGFFNGNLRLHSIVGHLLCIELCEVPE